MRKIIDKIGLVYLIMATRYNALTDIIYPIGGNIKHKISRRLRCQNYIFMYETRKHAYSELNQNIIQIYLS